MPLPDKYTQSAMTRTAMPAVDAARTLLDVTPAVDMDQVVLRQFPSRSVQDAFETMPAALQAAVYVNAAFGTHSSSLAGRLSLTKAMVETDRFVGAKGMCVACGNAVGSQQRHWPHCPWRAVFRTDFAVWRRIHNIATTELAWEILDAVARELRLATFGTGRRAWDGDIHTLAHAARVPAAFVQRLVDQQLHVDLCTHGVVKHSALAGAGVPRWAAARVLFVTHPHCVR